MSVAERPNFEEDQLEDLFHKIGDVCAVVEFVETTEELFEISLHKITALFKAGRGSIFTIKERESELFLAAAIGMPPGEERERVKRIGKGIIGRVAEEKRPIVVEDIGKDVRFADFKPRKSYRTPSFICVPLMIKDDLLGVINIADKESGLHFNANEMRLLDFLSNQIALNYRRIKLFQKFERSISETQNLKDELGRSDLETKYLKKQIDIQERLATLGKLAGGIAHEFNNPLDGVMRYTNLSLEHVHDDVVCGYLLEIKHGLDRMANIVKNLLACTRNQTISTERADFKVALEYALSGLKTEIAHKNITVEKKIQEGLPLILDLGIEGVLTNILHNAVDAVEDNGKITVGATCEDGVLAIMVTDTGCGISKEDSQKIFEPFFTSKEMDKGCGLGLTIVAEIVKSYEGKIHVKSKEGEGTVFTVQLPVK